MKKLQNSMLMILLICACTGYTQNNPNISTTAVPFLRISHDTKGSGMGSTGLATTPDASAMFYNIAKLPFSSEKVAINANYSPWLSEWSNNMYLASLGGYYKISDNEAVHGLIRYFNPGDIQFTDNTGNYLQSYHPNEFAVDLGYSRKLSDRIGIGLGLKYIRSDLSNGVYNGESFKAGNAIAADLGFYYDLKNENEAGWSLGAQLSNLGTKISYTKNGQQKEFIPANLGLGTSYIKTFDEQNKLILALDFNKLLVPNAPSDSAALVSYQNKSVVSSWFSSFSDVSFKEELKEFQISAGAEYWYNNLFAFRAGYFYENKRNGDRNYFSAGASVKYNVFTANFAYIAPSSKAVKNPLSNTVLFGLTINLNNKKAEK